jgi:hypothetical protein
MPSPQLDPPALVHIRQRQVQAIPDPLGHLVAPTGIEPLLAGERRVSVGLAFLQARRQTIYGGTSEIQRNILAKRVLDLGNEPKRGA